MAQSRYFQPPAVSAGKPRFTAYASHMTRVAGAHGNPWSMPTSNSQKQTAASRLQLCTGTCKHMTRHALPRRWAHLLPTLDLPIVVCMCACIKFDNVGTLLKSSIENRFPSISPQTLSLIKYFMPGTAARYKNNSLSRPAPPPTATATTPHTNTAQACN